ncbi:MAG TPA: 4-hydroxy-tetrahydrodipicolinate synthase [Symbiobacteriaceae bacterium]|nr:4-hydroxy-tetrahydrodipicolinate synthase [Symbiobacteriaceae bacterium]
MLRGAFPVMITPMNQDQSIDYGGLRNNVQFYLSQGVKGLIPLGSTGEFVSLARHERFKVAETVLEEVAGRVPVIVGTSAETTHDTIEYTQHAKEHGAAGAMIINPYYMKPKDEDIFWHYKTVTEAVDLPVLAYNNPWTTGIDMSLDLMLRLGELPGVFAVKESSGDIRKLRDLIRLGKGKVDGWCGWDDMAMESFLVGAVGWVSVAGNVIPAMVTELHDIAVEQGDWKAGWELYQKMLPLCIMIEASGKLVQVVKTAMNMIGQAGGPARSPRSMLNEAETARLTSALKEAGLI